eukprot:2082464-Rhodomonas_salina.1
MRIWRRQWQQTTNEISRVLKLKPGSLDSLPVRVCCMPDTDTACGAGRQRQVEEEEGEPRDRALGEQRHGRVHREPAARGQEHHGRARGHPRRDPDAPQGPAHPQPPHRRRKPPPQTAAGPREPQVQGRALCDVPEAVRDGPERPGAAVPGRLQRGPDPPVPVADPLSGDAGGDARAWEEYCARVGAPPGLCRQGGDADGPAHAACDGRGRSGGGGRAQPERAEVPGHEERDEPDDVGARRPLEGQRPQVAASQ